MRRLKDLIGGHVADLGGRDLISEAEFCIVRRCTLLTLELELLEARFEANDGAKAAELECYQRVASSLRRLLKSFGPPPSSRRTSLPIPSITPATMTPRMRKMRRPRLWSRSSSPASVIGRHIWVSASAEPSPSLLPTGSKHGPSCAT